MKVPCDWCGKEFKRRFSGIKRVMHHFCSEKCYINWQKGKHHSPKTEFRRGQTGYWKGKHKSEKTRRKISESIKKGIQEGRYHFHFPILSGERSPTKRPDVREKISRALMGNKNWRFVDQEKATKARMKACQEKPNKTEKRLIGIIERNNLPYLFNNTVTIGKFIPDFIHSNGSKKIIEMFGCFWHNCSFCGFKKDSNRERIDQEKQAMYNRMGYKLLVIWEHELKKEKEVVEKIARFENYGG